MNEGISRSASVAVRSLHPEPRTTGVKYQLVWLLLATKVHSAEYLNVKEVRQILLKVSTALLDFII